MANKTTNTVMLRLWLAFIYMTVYKRSRKWSKGDIEKYIIEMFRARNERKYIYPFEMMTSWHRALDSIFLSPLPHSLSVAVDLCFVNAKDPPKQCEHQLGVYDSVADAFFSVFTSKIRLYLQNIQIYEYTTAGKAQQFAS